MSMRHVFMSSAAVCTLFALSACGDGANSQKNQRKPALDSKQSLTDGKAPIHPGDEPYPFPGQNIGQNPGQNPGYNHDEKPTHPPVGPTPCGHQGIACHPGQGGPGQFPPTDINGKPVDHGTISACLDSFGQMGTPVHGSWAVEAREIKQVSVFSSSVFEDRSVGPRIIIIKDVNVLGSKEYRFLNPEALYCVKSVSVLQDNRIASCHSNNVVFASNVDVFVRMESQIVNCR